VTAIIRTLIVEDDMLTRAGLRTVLATDPAIDVVGEAATAEEAFRLIRELVPDIVLMDVQLPDRDGIDAVEQIRRDWNDDGPRVIVLTTFDYDEYVFRSLRAGASAFLLKRTRAEDIIESVRAVAEGQQLASPEITRRLISSFASAPPATPTQRNLVASLTPREVDVLVMIARGLTNQEIATELGVALETVRTHVKHVYWKCGARDRAHAVIAAYENGLVPRTP
jgi:DNA-binding NarL/FixJ family response regulator